METIDHPSPALDPDAGDRPLDDRTPPVPELADYRPTLLDDIAPTASEWRRAAIGTAIVHVVLVFLLLSIPTDPVEEVLERKSRVVTPLIDPPTRLTQKAPNTKPLSEELTAGPVPPAPPAVKPQPAPVRRFAAPPPAQAQVPRNANPALPQEPPKMAAVTPPNSQIASPVNLPPPPQIVQAPKLVLENVPPAPQSGQGTGRLKVPAGGVEDAIREIVKNGPSPRSVGDDVDDTYTPSLSPNPTPSPTRPKTNLELKSDSQGIDFKPYMLQVLQAVRRNWFAVMPEGVKLGQRGRVLLQFSIAKDGKITKVVFASESGIKTLDRAAVAALTASDPLPQLPAGYKGDQVILQFTFLYNAPR